MILDYVDSLQIFSDMTFEKDDVDVEETLMLINMLYIMLTYDKIKEDFDIDIQKQDVHKYVDTHVINKISDKEELDDYLVKCMLKAYNEKNEAVKDEIE